MPIPAVLLRNVKKRYIRGNSAVEVLNDVNLTVEQGQFLAVMGPSGSGKTTILNLIGGLDLPDSGHISVMGEHLENVSEPFLTRWRAINVGFVFQFYNLMPMLSAAQNVELPLLLTNLDSRERRKKASAALELVGLADRADHKPAELSGGQQQRVGIARAIVADPALLLCDEPTGDLDRYMADDVLRLLTLLNVQRGKTIIMVTHDPKAADFASRRVEVDKGQILSQELEAV